MCSQRMMFDQVMKNLRRAYDRAADERQAKAVSPWKAGERAHFLSLLRAEARESLLEIGAGTGVHGEYFQDNGIDVICTDLSPAMVSHCERKGLTAHVMDFLSLDFPAESFDALFAMNCLLHVPRSELSEVLEALQDLLVPGGLFYLGQYSGPDEEGIWPQDHYQPKRFFSRLSDESIKQAVSEHFMVTYFKQVPVRGEPGQHFQSMILRRPPREL